ncbi:benzoylformate decarboxylase [Streptomyces sp. NPDC046870]|uniref:benzoylformate decarboxylase n=1 Tax=Streptomyces sp. NPDC046870 TaxID=3155135 RepID=UPI003451D177
MNAITVRQAVFDLLRGHGVDTVFGNPGSTELPMFRDFPADFRYVLGLQESVVVAMADGHAQATRKLAVVNLHSAAGVGHAMGSLYTAAKTRAPLVVIAGQQSRSLLAGEPYLLNEDPGLMASPHVKWSREPARPEDVPAAIARACHLALTPPMGPVLVSVPADDWDRPALPLATRKVGTVLNADPELLAETGRALAGARSPAFVVGAEVDREQALDDVVELAEAHGARVWAAPMSHRCSFPERHPLFAGFLPPVREGIAAELAKHDMVLVLGAPAFTYHVPGEGPFLPPGTRLHQLTDDAQRAAWTPEGTSVLTSVRPAVRQLLAAHRPDRPRPRPAPRRPAERVEATGPYVTAPYLVQTLADLRPQGSVIVEEAPSTRPVMCEHLPNDGPDSFFTTAGGALGYGLPAAVGMALARSDRQVIAVLGDGSAMYAIQALWSAARLGVRLAVVVVDNGGYATVDSFARRFGIDKPAGTELGGLDFPALAAAQGCRGEQVTTPHELGPALRRAFASPLPYVVSVLVQQ